LHSLIEVAGGLRIAQPVDGQLASTGRIEGKSLDHLKEIGEGAECYDRFEPGIERSGSPSSVAAARHAEDSDAVRIHVILRGKPIGGQRGVIDVELRRGAAPADGHREYARPPQASADPFHGLEHSRTDPAGTNHYSRYLQGRFRPIYHQWQFHVARHEEFVGPGEFYSTNTCSRHDTYSPF
jgi:hypothetical protein